jgi:hypothetical protein
MIVLFLAMRAINRNYTRVTIEVAADDELHTLPSRVHAPGAGVPAGRSRCR